MLSTRYYCVTVPGELEGLYEAECSDRDILFYETRSREDGYGGFVFGLTLLPQEDFSYLQWPYFDYYGTLVTPEGETFSVVSTLITILILGLIVYLLNRRTFYYN